MKKFTKGMLIAAGDFLVLWGIGLTTAGGVMGASMSELTGGGKPEKGASGGRRGIMIMMTAMTMTAMIMMTMMIMTIVVIMMTAMIMTTVRIMPALLMRMRKMALYIS